MANERDLNPGDEAPAGTGEAIRRDCHGPGRVIEGIGGG
jgi:hypothetical protein